MKPKFRAWDVHNKEMLANDQLIIWDGNVYANDPGKVSVDKMRGWSIDEKYLMQSTGLFDKNGQEIFEGDVFVYVENDKPISENVTVKFGQYIDESSLFNPIQIGFYVEAKKGTAAFDVEEMYNEYKDVIEVIGNIYKNPELVEVENE